MKKINITCNFGGQKSPFAIYVEEPTPGLHPLLFQREWLWEERGGEIPPEIMDSFQKLGNIAIENDVSFEELCVYALGQASHEKEQVATKTSPPTHQSNSGAEDEAELTIGPQHHNRTEILLSPRQLDKHFEDAFYLLAIYCKNASGQVHHTILLSRENECVKLSSLVKEDQVTVEQLQLYGKIEYQGKGPDLPVQTLERILDLYQ